MDLDKLEALAKDASAGERKVKRVHTRDEARYEFGVDKACWWVDTGSWVDLEDYGLFFTEADAKFFEAADPQIVLRLIAENRALRSALEGHRAGDEVLLELMEGEP